MPTSASQWMWKSSKRFWPPARSIRLKSFASETMALKEMPPRRRGWADVANLQAYLFHQLLGGYLRAVLAQIGVVLLAADAAVVIAVDVHEVPVDFIV